MNTWTTTKLTGKIVRVLSAELPTGETFTAEIVSIAGARLVSACFWINGTQVFHHAGQSIRSYQAQAEGELAWRARQADGRPVDVARLRGSELGTLPVVRPVDLEALLTR